MIPERPTAVVTIAIPPEAEAALAEYCDLVLVGPNPTREEVIAAIGEAEGLLCPAPWLVDNDVLDAAPHLRVIANFGVGFNNVDLAELDRRGIVVCNTPGVLSEAVADLTLGLILAAARRIIENAGYATDGSWAARKPLPPLGFDLQGKTLGLVGFGRIGRAVATRAHAFGMRVIYHDIYEPPPGWEYAQLRSFSETLAESDMVSLHVNLTPETHHHIGAAQLALMKPTAWIVNTSRGPVIDGAALAEALRAGTIAGAALDVLETEPPDADEPLLHMRNVIVLPHVGSATVETRAAMLDLAVRNLRAVLMCENPPECVNPQSLEKALIRR